MKIKKIKKKGLTIDGDLINILTTVEVKIIDKINEVIEELNTKGKAGGVFAVYPCLGCMPSKRKRYGNLCGHKKPKLYKARLF